MINKSNQDLRLAAIDIGSNALRLHISRVRFSEKDSYPSFKRIEQVRFPLRLGTDVFSLSHKISPKNEAKFIEVMHAFKNVMEVFEVNDYMACATSAMRESKNGNYIVERVKREVGISIDIISGDMEAELINKSILNYVSTNNFVHIDVGGGSTEVNIYHNLQKIDARSFNMGSVRSIADDTKNVTKEYIERENQILKDWVQKAIKPLSSPVNAVGTGGNINKLYDLSKQSKNKILSFREIERLYKELSKRNYQERISDFGLNDDRADVIVPATEIYLKVMKAAGIKEIIIPKVGLREGIIQHLFDKNNIAQN
ncbi:phosphatase [Bernardetia sp.]|uniref:Ppx/GppA phosphatase family protein n=1 Tax=Bernardetia sp. TaxID=1937974 RepID=UPI0025BA2757|nr:phosphatase [Bernardetia sp.]